MPLDFAALSLVPLGLMFAGSAAAVWFAGSRLAIYVGAVTDKTGLGQAFMGMLLLGGITSLPELAAVSTSAAMGNAPLAINNLLGTASINLVLLALSDIYFGRDALTAIAARPSTLMQGVLSMLVATMVAMIATAGDVALFGFGFGAGAGLVALVSIAALWLSSQYERRHVWAVVGDDGQAEQQTPAETRSTGRLSLYIAACALLILVAGYVLASAADVIAEKTGIAAGLVGFVLVGLATSLPELSSIIGALRLRRYQMAIGDIFGTNIFNILLIFMADIIYQGEPVLGQAGRFETIGAILTVLMTGIFVVGLLERKDRTVLRMGFDSAAALVTFVAGLSLLSRSLP